MHLEKQKINYKPGWVELVAVICFLVAVLVSQSQAARIKDVASLDGLGEVQLVGYGLVVGLNGTGDGTRTQFTVQSVANMLQKMGIVVPPEKLRLRNVAAVMVTGNLPAFVKSGKKVDVTISSLGDARSLEGGTLLMTPLQAADGEYYAQAQGAVSVGGMSAGNRQKGSHSSKGHTLAGSIPNGAVVHREVASADLTTGELRWMLAEPDFSSAVAMAQALNNLFPGSTLAEDAGSVLVKVPANRRNDYMSFIAQAEMAEFTPGAIARVILNEKTGTLVSGADVRISEVAVSHGSIVINVENTPAVSQPNALSAGRTQVTNQQTTTVQEPKPEMRVIPAVNNAGQLAQALNSLGVSPLDIIAIFQAIKKAGALHAELVIM